jgi:hypothetical protein
MKWLFAVLLVLQAHFAASYLVPLDSGAQREFGGLLRWAWPWSIGDGGILGRIPASGEYPISGVWLGGGAALLFILAALAVMGWWVPFGWWRVLAMGGAILSLLLMVGFFGATKLLPMVLDLVVLWAAALFAHGIRPALRFLLEDSVFHRSLGARFGSSSAKRDGLRVCVSSVCAAPSSMISASSWPIAGECITPWPEEPLAR